MSVGVKQTKPMVRGIMFLFHHGSQRLGSIIVVLIVMSLSIVFANRLKELRALQHRDLCNNKN
jgi:hypothetical protein